ncbi:MAG: DNA topoisomerase I, partial [Bacilli bacterium]|nr:DNA topoisomerase I [Bacilli bacterium]
QVIVFDGYLKVYSDYEDTKDQSLPVLNVNEVLTAENIEKEQHFTKPPARYTEAKLIKEMEELGIGRPSTYATTMETLKTRGYVTVTEKKFVPTEIGIEITDKLQEYFSHLINVKYTANMEEDLDKIAEGDIVWYDTLQSFYDEFEPSIKHAFDSMPKKEAEKTGEDCPNCGNPLVIRKGKYGSFTACSNYPECKYIKSEPKEVIEVAGCPNCDGKIVEKKSKKGKVFYGCNQYPTCKTAYWDKPIGRFCPKCKSMLVEKKGKNPKIKCSSCDYTE